MKCDELKWKWAFFPYLDAPEKQHESAVNAGYVKVVLKDEAEKQLSVMRIEIRHQKYKRCLAMAKICKARYDEEYAKENWCGLSWEYISKEMKYWERWRRRWLELAEKFRDKEAK